MEAKGERFDIARLISQRVPDDENFAMTPLLAPIFSLPMGDPRQPIRTSTNTANGEITESAGNLATNIDIDRYNVGNHPDHLPGFGFGMAEDLPGWVSAMQHPANPARAPISTMNPVEAASIILDKLKASEPFLAELKSDDAARHYCRFNIPYEKWKPGGVPGMMEHFVVCKWLIRFLCLHAEAEMVSGQTDQALEDINIMFRVEDGLRDEPLLMSQLVGLASVGVLLQPVGEGLAEKRWSEDQLRVLQERLQKTDLITSELQALYGERDICYNQTFDQGYMFPRGWNRFEQVNVNRAFQEAVFPRINVPAREISPSVNHHSIASASGKWTSHGIWFRALLHHDIFGHNVASRLL